jgi:hypothetical protein
MSFTRTLSLKLDCLENFKELSYDDKNNESLCQNTVYKYYNFDKIVKKEDKDSGCQLMNNAKNKFIISNF